MVKGFAGLILASLCLLVCFYACGQPTPPLVVQEEDGTPRGVATTIKFSNGAVAQSGTIFTVTTGGSAGAVTACKIIENLAADDDDMPFWSPLANVTLDEAWCVCTGTCTTEADLSFETRQTGTASTVDAVGGTVNCEDEATAVSKTTLTSDNTVDALDLIRFDVDTTPSPETDTYTICATWNVD